MPNRIIKESICTSDDIDNLSWFEEVLWYRLIVQCDDFGRFDGRPAIIKNTCFPLKDDCLKLKDVVAALNTLARTRMITFYCVDGKQYLYIPSWRSHQTPRANTSKYPDPPAESEAEEITCNHLQADEINCKQSQADSHDIRYSIFDIRYSDNRPFADVVIEKWNAIGVQNISKISAGSQRAKCLVARIREYDEETVLKAIDRVNQSSFLKGKNDRGWTINFDWFIKPGNFVKVLEGNYNDKPMKVNGTSFIGRLDPAEVRRAYKQMAEELKKEEGTA